MTLIVIMLRKKYHQARENFTVDKYHIKLNNNSFILYLDVSNEILIYECKNSNTI